MFLFVYLEGHPSIHYLKAALLEHELMARDLSHGRSGTMESTADHSDIAPADGQPVSMAPGLEVRPTWEVTTNAEHSHPPILHPKQNRTCEATKCSIANEMGEIMRDSHGFRALPGKLRRKQAKVCLGLANASIPMATP